MGQDAGVLAKIRPLGVMVSSSLDEVIRNQKPDVALVTTSSSIESIAETLRIILSSNVNVVTSCEELFFADPKTSETVRLLDQIARDKKVALLATGVNPGFVMDYLPLVLSSLSQRVDSVVVERVQDATTRREPFKKKIGFGATEEEFAKRVADRTLRHVGLKESLQFLLHHLGLEYKNMTETIEPVRTKSKIVGVLQTATATDTNGREVGRLVFRASVGEKQPRDRVLLKGEPDTELIIPGAMHGDIATCSILLNAVWAVVNAAPGYRTMADIPPPHWKCPSTFDIKKSRV